MTGPSAPVPDADRKVRVGWTADADAVGAVQARAWREAYAPVLPPELLARADPAAFAEAWRVALTRPPTARHRLLVALQDEVLVGFAAVAPSEDPDADPSVGELVALHVDPAATGQGHGSRLVTAAAETMRADGFGTARTWLLARDDGQRRFLESAGWGPDGAHRELDLTGDGSATVRQVRLHTDLREEA